MWQIDNRTPFAAAQSWVRDLNGAETWIVVVKATFDVAEDGTTSIASSQPQPNRSPVYRGEPAGSSIEYDNDFVLGKVTTDVVINGTAYAPSGRPASSVDVGFRVGSLSKVLRIVGDRHWTLGGTLLSAPVPFVTLPIQYENAFGGSDPASSTSEVHQHWPNPAGTGFLVSDDAVGVVRIANVEYPDDPVTSWRGRPKAAGFGVIASHWQERAGFSGTYDSEWERNRQPLLPTDFDMRHYQSVPRDQQAPDFLSGGETVALANLTPSGSLTFRLPILSLRLVTRFMDEERRPLPMSRLHTVIIEPDLQRVSLVFHSAIECHAKVYKLDHTRVELDRPETEDDSEEMIGGLLDL
jgi:hypothetical protein